MEYLSSLVELPGASQCLFFGRIFAVLAFRIVLRFQQVQRDSELTLHGSLGKAVKPLARSGHRNFCSALVIISGPPGCRAESPALTETTVVTQTLKPSAPPVY